MDESGALLEALRARAVSSDDRRKIDIAWSDFETAIARGQKTTFAELVVRRRLLTKPQVDAFLAAERAFEGSGTAILEGAAGYKPRTVRSPATIFVGTFAVLAVFGGAALWKIGTPAPTPPAPPTIEAGEPERQTAFTHTLEVAIEEGTSGNLASSERSLKRAGELARTPAEFARLDRVRAKIEEVNSALPAPPEPPRPVERVDTPAPVVSETPLPPIDKPSEPAIAPPAPPPAPAPREAPPEADSFTDDEEAALAYVAAQLLELSRFCTHNKAYHEARAELENALSLAPFAKDVKKELDDLGDLASDPTKYYRDNADHERSNAHLRAAYRLSDLALSFKKAGDRERYAHWVDEIQEHFPGETTEKALGKLGLVYFEPYLEWMEPPERKRYEAGSEKVDGAWKDKDAVSALNKKHASWSDPWVLTDGVHELRTTVPLRLGRKLLAQISSYRRFFLKQFSRAWDLRAPPGKLPVILARNQAEYREQIAACGQSLGVTITPPEGSAAFYYAADRSLNPCFVTLEAQTLDGGLLKFGWDSVLLVLKHEITHQIAFEYSRGAGAGGTIGEKNFWVVESIANFMCFYAIDRGHWHLTRPRTIPTRVEGTFEVSPFAWCLEHVDQLPRLADYFETPPARFMNEQSYGLATCVAYFLLFGEHKRYRDGYVRLCELVHEHRDSAKTFDECFPGLDRAQLNRQFLRFVGGMTLDE